MQMADTSAVGVTDFLSLALQVRCAAVFALGTFVGNSAERTDHSTTIDHNVAMMLAQLINDGSPMVRKVCGASSVAKVRACGCPCVAVLMCLELSPHRASCPTYVHHSILMSAGSSVSSLLLSVHSRVLS